MCHIYAKKKRRFKKVLKEDVKLVGTTEKKGEEEERRDSWQFAMKTPGWEQLKVEEDWTILERHCSQLTLIKLDFSKMFL